MIAASLGAPICLVLGSNSQEMFVKDQCDQDPKVCRWLQLSVQQSVLRITHFLFLRVLASTCCFFPAEQRRQWERCFESTALVENNAAHCLGLIGRYGNGGPTTQLLTSSQSEVWLTGNIRCAADLRQQTGFCVSDSFCLIALRVDTHSIFLVTRATSE